MWCDPKNGQNNLKLTEEWISKSFLFVIYDYKKNAVNDLDILDINKNPTLTSDPLTYTFNSVKYLHYAWISPELVKIWKYLDLN